MPSPPEEAGTTRLPQRFSNSSKTSPRRTSSHIPDRFKDGEDADDDVTAPPPPRTTSKREASMQYMHQSIFSMIAAAGSKSDFHARFDDSSDSDGETTKVETQTPELHVTSKSPVREQENKAPDTKAPSMSDSQFLPPESPPVARDGAHRQKRSESRLQQSMSNSRFKSLHGKEQVTKEEQSRLNRSASPTLYNPEAGLATMTPRSVPVLSRMIEAQNRYDTTVASLPAAQQLEAENLKIPEDSAPPRLLSVRLKEIFGFERPEKVIGEYPCWLMQSALLQGYMYLTEGHICFYAYLPQKPSAAVKSGNLSKRGRKRLAYNRYWFSLKGDVFSYYSDSSKLYFPSGHIDLRYGISASLSEQKDKSKETKDFTVVTDTRAYHFRADSTISAKEWVRALQNVIFRSHNEGARVKISLPLESVIDIEENPMIDFAETFSIRVLDSSETFAIDEYFFSFFEYGKDAFEVLKGLVNKTGPQDAISSLGWKDGSPRRESQARNISHRSHSLERSADAEPIQSHRRRLSPKAAFTGRRQSEVRPTGITMSQHERSFHKKQRHDSTDSFVQSIDPTESSVAMQSTTDGCETASQILTRSEIFQSPTIHRLRQAPSLEAIGRRHSDETTRSALKTEPLGVSNDERPSRRASGPQAASSESELETRDSDKPFAASAPKLHDIVRAGTYPLQRAAGFAEYIKSRSKQMSSLLASESMGYIEKVSGMWTGGGKHYAEGNETLPESIVDQEDIERGCSHGDRFRAHFALPPSEKLQATYFGYLHRVLPLYGKIYVGNTRFCFRSLLPGTRTKMILPIKDIENVEKEKGFRFGYQGLVVIIRGHEELFFEFNASDSRDDCAVTLHQSLESVRYMVESMLLAQQEKEEADAAKAEHQLLQEARLNPSVGHSQESATYFDDTRASIINFKPTESLRITCLTIGSRGDVQPYIALCKGLLAEGHRPKIATHLEFEPWIRRHGIDFAPVEGDPAELMRICIENGMFTYSFLKEASQKFRGWIDDLLSSAWQSCQDSDVLIESPSAMAGIHIAEALRIPYFRGFSMPWTRTRAYPHAVAVPEHKMGGAYNYISYVMFDNVFWKGISGQVNRWRKSELGLRGTNLDKMQPNKVPFLYNFSPSVVPPPLDYPDWVRVTGYWFLDEGPNWAPPTPLADFIKRARQDGKKLIYVGFGSIVVSDPAALTRTIIQSVQKADVRCILSKGWSDRLGDPTSSRPEIPLPPEIHQIQSAPHDWLFTQIDAAAHHGGAGTTGASLRAGVPTIVKPFFGDQFFFGSRVEDLGVGICMKKLNVSVFSRAIWEATHSERMIRKARRLSEQIRKENGVENAIQAIYRDLEYAKTLTRQRSALSSTPLTPSGGNEAGAVDDDENLENIEETWTFVDDDPDQNSPQRYNANQEKDLEVPHGRTVTTSDSADTKV